MVNSIDRSLLYQGDRRVLAKAITLIESSQNSHRDEAMKLLMDCLPRSGNSIRIGVSGVPGVGKSTFIESFGLNLINKDHKVAVLAIDPSSPKGGGSILADKTRMEFLSRDPRVFIRPSPTRGSWGGVTARTREAIILLESAGFDTIIIETVGVGQSEYVISDMIDYFLLLIQPGAGDEVQGIKKGIIELADFIIINKADGATKSLAKIAEINYMNAVRIIGKDGKPHVMSISSIVPQGIDELITKIFELNKTEKNIFNTRRKNQNLKWFDTQINEQLRIIFFKKEGVFEKINELRESIKNEHIPVPVAINEGISALKTLISK